MSAPDLRSRCQTKAVMVRPTMILAVDPPVQSFTPADKRPLVNEWDADNAGDLKYPLAVVVSRAKLRTRNRQQERTTA